jgi:hypothetical protein
MPAISTVIDVPDIIKAKAMVSRQTEAGICRMNARGEKEIQLGMLERFLPIIQFS